MPSQSIWRSLHYIHCPARCSAPFPFRWQSSPGPPARASNAITPTRARCPHTTLPELGVVPAARRRFYFLIVPDGSPLRAVGLPSPSGHHLQRTSRSHAHGHALKDTIKRRLVCVVLVVLGWACGGGNEGARRGARGRWKCRLRSGRTQCPAAGTEYGHVCPRARPRGKRVGGCPRRKHGHEAAARTVGWRTNVGAHTSARKWGKVVVRRRNWEGNEEEPLLRPSGQGVDVQCARVVLVKSFVVSSASCLLLLIIIRLHWPSAVRNKACNSAHASVYREPTWLRWRHA
jgi:hypothetical protein